MKPILTIGVPVQLGMKGLEDMKAVKGKRKELFNDYHVIVYLQAKGTEWKFDVYNLATTEEEFAMDDIIRMFEEKGIMIASWMSHLNKTNDG